MLRSLKKILGYRVKARDGVAGRVTDMLFDDRSWGVRYLVAGTGGWLLYHEGLLPPQSAGEPDWVSGVVPVSLTKDEVEGCRSVESHPPVSRRYLRALADYYTWEPYGFGVGASPLGIQAPGVLSPIMVLPPRPEETRSVSDPHLQSARDASRYRVMATDGEVGHVADFLLQTDGWGIRYLVVETRRWIPGRNILVSLAWVTSMDWPAGQLRLNLKRKDVLGSVEFDPSAPVNRQYEVGLYDYYGRPRFRQVADAPAGTSSLEGRGSRPKHRRKLRGLALRHRPLEVEELEHAHGTQTSESDPGRL
jgi:hypothetical protein